MKKYLLSLLFLSCLPAMILGCQTYNNDGFPNENISKVSILTSDGAENVHTNFSAVYEDQETLDLFKNTISNAVKQDGIVDMAEPEFELNVIFADGNKESYYLWVGEKGQKSALMNVKNTHTIYAISEGITDQLVELLK